MQLKNDVVLVSGAIRGFGAVLVALLKERGAAKIYAASRTPSAVDVHGVEPIHLDITDPSQVRAVAD
ncbi:MAG: short-chain dehydrogenase, partial [Subtercola sp.]|nr:short-chain dehydrogenase [Subtercola sp.]